MLWPIWRGSPPRGRGKAYRAAGHCTRLGITPAWAGKSRLCGTLQRRHTDHPRAGGEKSNWDTQCRSMVGSPPHRRGKAGENHLVAQLPGITPAWAGKSGVPCCSIRPWWDHPRVGGEKPVKIILWHSCQGSPPHGRGKVVFRVVVFALGGITPAWAGKSSGQHNASLVNKDHPRVGGEKPAVAAHVRAQLGSPPRGRGKGMELPPPVARHGITPAWAGKSICFHFFFDL